MSVPPGRPLPGNYYSPPLNYGASPLGAPFERPGSPPTPRFVDWELASRLRRFGARLVDGTIAAVPAFFLAITVGRLVAVFVMRRGVLGTKNFMDRVGLELEYTLTVFSATLMAFAAICYFIV